MFTEYTGSHLYTVLKPSMAFPAVKKQTNKQTRTLSRVVKFEIVD